MKKQKWTEKPITWGGYLKLCGICSVIGMVTTAFYWITLFDIHPIESIKDAIHERFGKKTNED